MRVVLFLKDAAPPDICPLPLPDTLPILCRVFCRTHARHVSGASVGTNEPGPKTWTTSAARRRTTSCKIGKSTRLNSSHANISYAVFCLKKKTHTISFRPHFNTDLTHNPP